PPERAFDLLGPDLLPARDDEVVEPALDSQPPVVVDPPDVAGAKPPVGRERAVGGTAVAPHERRSLEQDLRGRWIETHARPPERPALVHDAAAALGQPVGLDDPSACALGDRAETGRKLRAPDQDGPEPREVDARPHEPAEHGR